MGDLISRAALLDEFHSLCGPQTGDGWDNMGVRNLIMRQKAVDAVPVVHGRWGESAECSVCGFQPWYEHDIHTLTYCPHCGAKMDGDA